MKADHDLGTCTCEPHQYAHGFTPCMQTHLHIRKHGTSNKGDEAEVSEL